jgi:hypothetical protein
VLEIAAMKHLKILAMAALATAAFTAPAAASGDDLTWTRLGRTFTVDGPRVTPLRVLEDSRCPMEARCVRAGEVRLRVRITMGRRSTVRDIVSGNRIPVADGSLELVSVMPATSVQRPIRRSDYRFGFRFAGGL